MSNEQSCRPAGMEPAYSNQGGKQRNEGLMDTLRGRTAVFIVVTSATLVLGEPQTPAYADHENVGVPTIAAYHMCHPQTDEALVGVSIGNHSQVSWLDASLDIPGRGEFSHRFGPADPHPELMTITGPSGSTYGQAGEVGYTLILEGHDNGQDHVATGTLAYPDTTCPSERKPGESYTFSADTTPPPPPPPEPTETCSENFGPAPFSDRASIPIAHRSNVDCTYGLGIVRGFANNTYGYELRVRRDQMASFIARTLDARGVQLPEGSEGDFGDVSGRSTHARNIYRLAEAGIVRGTTHNTYSPGLQVTRDQMASFLLRATEYGHQRSMSTQTQAFSDVGPGNVHYSSVNGASQTGLAKGYADGNYQPRNQVRRDQMATFLNRLYGTLGDAAATAQ